MFVVTVVAARWRVHHLAVPSLPIARVEMGGVALAFLLAAEFGLVTWLRGIPTKEYLTPCQERSITWKAWSFNKLLSICWPHRRAAPRIVPEPDEVSRPHSPDPSPT